ncbi:PGDYG domain-containing protein [Marinobacter nauticus]|jgi:hypothetical protein|uniref:PGDYG protein n=1 Tax=Marinobacter nauticus TaxID=2743 RepID=A0A1M2UXF0_MARNT|nr:PGDYG domain-containing protein [Marinobacter nauticus]OJS99977.1 hypothetical protein BEE62_07640 [Marinobacter nauticus]
MQNIPVDLSQHPESKRVIKKPVPVKVVFAECEGVVRTLEGNVSYKAGDAILTGVKGESWPIQRSKFLESYTPDGEIQPGVPGNYLKKPLAVWALQLEEPCSVKVGWNADPLQGGVGDWLVQYGKSDFGIVNADVFTVTYEILR